jgi:hypothetical protein
LDCGINQTFTNGEQLVEFYTLVYTLGLTILIVVIAARVVANKTILGTETHLATVSWNG